MAEQIKKVIEELQNELEPLSKKYTVLREKLEKAKEQLALEDLKNIDEHIPQYTARLKRLKKIADDFMEQYPSGTVEYAFLYRINFYTNDWHDPTHDPLNWMIQEYDLLEMSNHMEIVIEYATKEVRKFVEDWMKENITYANVKDIKSMFQPLT
jgi:hypothetical protein